MTYWLIKTEPGDYSIDDLARDKSAIWSGVRNYQARNFLKDMKKGDKLLVYHSNANPSAITGLGEVASEAVPDPTQFDKKSIYFDPKATQENPRWFAPKVKYVAKFSQAIALDKLRAEKRLNGMVLLQKGSRLSVQPVTLEQYKVVTELADVSK